MFSLSRSTYTAIFSWEPSKDDSGQVWFKLAQWFQRRRFFKKFTDGCQVMAIAHTGELKIAV
jgi:hypothetical protein